MASCLCLGRGLLSFSPCTSHHRRLFTARTESHHHQAAHCARDLPAACSCSMQPWYCTQHKHRRCRWRGQASSSAMAGDASSSSSSSSSGSENHESSESTPRDSSSNASRSSPHEKANDLRNADGLASSEETCLIESRQSVKNFSHLQLDEINQNISNRRNRIFLLMEEVRRLRIQQRIKGGERTREEEVAEEKFPSVIPLLPPLTKDTWNEYLKMYLSAVAVLILFGGLIAPALELRIGVGGTSYADFVHAVHLPSNLAAVDPIVAAFCGGAVGVLSALLVVEANNAKAQERLRCAYCGGTGYLTCGTCVGTGVKHGTTFGQLSPSSNGSLISNSKKQQKGFHPTMPGGNGQTAQPLAKAQAQDQCGMCSGTGKVMCTACLCTGKALATEHDPRMDPFN